MKKFVALLLIAILCFCFASCTAETTPEESKAEAELKQESFDAENPIFTYAGRALTIDGVQYKADVYGESAYANYYFVVNRYTRDVYLVSEEYGNKAHSYIVPVGMKYTDELIIDDIQVLPPVTEEEDK